MRYRHPSSRRLPPSASRPAPDPAEGRSSTFPPSNPLADCMSESLRTSKDAYQDLLCLESVEAEASSQRKQRHSFPQFKHPLRMRESNPIVFYSRCSRVWRKIILLTATPNARICLNLLKD